jgi:hypothetical protein
MPRVGWILLFLIGAVVFIEPLRERVRPEVEFALNPVYRWEAKNRVNAISRVLERARSEGRPLPRPRDFHRFLAELEGDEAALDPWGQPYFLARRRRSFQVGSAGPDRTSHTPDDILSSTIVVPAEPPRR